MADACYYDAALQVPAAGFPDDCPVAQGKFEIACHGGMILLRLAPTVPGPEGDSYGVLLYTSRAKTMIHTLEVIHSNLGR